MVFSSVIFLCIFLPVVTAGYYVLPKKVRNIWLLLASLAFYACSGPKYLIYLISSILVNYIFGILISRFARVGAPADERGMTTDHTASQKLVLIAAIVVNIGSLLYFKYTGMLLETVNDLFAAQIKIPEIVLPVGISFYTFQCLSYVIDVYRTEGAALPDGNIRTLCAKDPVRFALYISMFPQLLQGPIIRYGEVEDTLNGPVITADELERGIERFIIGLAKKAVIADTLGEVADRIFDIAPSDLSSSVAWLGAILYTLQIYFDFSGYTDMAIGIGHLFGFSFRENFNYPYISKSITEFWRRWHISLSNWFRDYLYIPLGGNRRGNVYVNLLIVFLATGIWHGAAWGFLVWGMWHGLFMLVERALRNRSCPKCIPGAVLSLFKWGYTMFAVVCGWVLFRLEDLIEALSYIKAMFGFGAKEYNAFSVGFFLDRRLAFFLIISSLACVPWAQVMPRHISAVIASFATGRDKLPRISRYVSLILLLVISYVFIVNSTYSPFIYFRF